VCSGGTCAAPAAGDLKVQVKTADTVTADNWLRPYFVIANTGTTSVPMTELTLRYWYTLEAPQSELYTCWFATVGIGNTSATFGAASGTNADHYMQLSFSSGTLAAGETSEVQTGVHKSDWTNYDESNDWSYPSSTSYVEWDKVTLYRNGILVWGTEP
jgi:hypothetical protein